MNEVTVRKLAIVEMIFIRLKTGNSPGFSTLTLVVNFDNNMPSYWNKIYRIRGSAMEPHVFVTFLENNCLLIALADTGAGISVTASTFFEKLGPFPIDNNNLIIVKRVGTGDPFHTIGLVYLDHLKYLVSCC